MNTADRRRMIHVRDHIDRIDDYCREGSAVFARDRRTQDAVLHCLTMIGEALGALSLEAYRLLGSLPPRLPRGPRSILVHEYWGVDLDIVWATIERDLSPLRSDIERALGSDAPE